jgi:hypothetical protein
MTSIHHIILFITELSREKIRFIKWILKSIKLYPDIQFEVLLTIIDSEIIDYKDKLHRARIRPRTLPLINSIPYVKGWIEFHPLRGNPNAFLFISLSDNSFGNQLSENALYR